MARDLIATRDVSVSQACRATAIDRKTFSYEPKKKTGDAVIENLLKSYSAQYPTYGFVKLFNLIRNNNYTFNHKRVYRIYCELRLNLKIKPKKRLAPRTKIKLKQPENINQCWSLDFMSDGLIHFSFKDVFGADIPIVFALIMALKISRIIFKTGQNNTIFLFNIFNLENPRKTLISKDLIALIVKQF